MNVKSFYFGWLLLFLSFGSNPANADEKVIHTREVYKVIDSFKLTIDVFHTNQSYEHDNNTPPLAQICSITFCAILHFAIEIGINTL